MKIHWAITTIVAAALLSGLAVACGDDDEGEETPEATSPATAAATGTAGGGAAPTIDVTLREFSVTPDPTSVAPGQVTFSATNEGPEDEHELVIIRSDLAPADLPTAEDGSVDETQVDVIDEIEEFPVGETQELTVDLDAGSYVLICNIVEEEEGEALVHYELGMRTAFTVE